jgi:outer membrane lipoprotein-sorting protein
MIENNNFSTMKKYIALLFFILCIAGWSVEVNAQLSAEDIIRKADEKVRGNSSKSTITMKIIRPNWTREMTMKAWSKGDELSIILVTAPARDKGIAFLKRDQELWNWQPTINRIIKMPPSMMMQSWMGSDFTNDDLVKESSIIHDYTHKIIGEENIEGRLCYTIELIPKEEAAVVWGKIISWVDKKDFLQLKSEMYDEDGFLVNTMYGKNIKMLGGKLLPALLEVIPADEEGHMTQIEYNELEFEIPIESSFFSTKNLKRVR